MVYGWVSRPEHSTVVVYYVQNSEAIMGFIREQEVMACESYQVVETRPVQKFEEAMKLMK
jgi:hypothetical protein